MATELDVIDQLVKMTENGSLRWTPTTGGGGTSIAGWRTGMSDCDFSLRGPGSGARLYVRYPGTSLATELATGAQLDGLLETVEAMYKRAPTTKDEMLEIALRCLVEGEETIRPESTD